jgi:hypothetical protein
MPQIIFYGIAIFAGFRALCPPTAGFRDHDPCPDPLGKVLFAIFAGAIAAVAYIFLFMGNRALEWGDLIAVSILAYLFSNFIWTLFFTKRER